MGLKTQKTQWTRDFKGFRESVIPGANPQLSPDVLNTKFRHGKAIGRGGMTEFQGVTAAASPTPIIGLFNYRKASNTHELLRMLTSNVEKFSGGAWSDVTPATTLTGTSTTRPQYTIIDDTLVFTNEGEDTPKKYTGSGDFSDVGGSPPYCKAIHAYLGFLFAINISTAGTFTDVSDGHRTAQFSDDWDNNWEACDNNTIVLDETPGAWIVAENLGRSMYAGKTDGIVKVTFSTANQFRFTQELLPIDVGVLAPLSYKKVGEAGIIFLGTDGLIYLISMNGAIEVISHGWITDLLTSRLGSNKLQYARAVVDSEEDTYYLIYDRTGLAGQANDSYISYNFRTKEWSHGNIGKSVYACEVFKASEYVAEDVLLAESALVDTFDDSSVVDDNGTAISRYWTSGWQKMGEEGWLHSIRAQFEKSGNAKVRIDVAFNLEENAFDFPQTFGLKGGLGDDNVEVEWRAPGGGVLCDWFNVRVRMFHNSASAKTILNALAAVSSPTLPVSSGPERERPSTGL